MGDEEAGETDVTLQVCQEVEHRRLHRHVQCAGRLVGNEQRRVRHQGAGDADALPLPSRELVGITAGDLSAQAHPGEPVGHAGLPVAPGQASPLQAQRLGDDLADEHPGVERPGRVLEDDGHVATVSAQPGPRQVGDVRPAEQDAAGRRLEEPDDAASHGGLAGPALSDERHDLASAKTERHPVHRANRPEVHDEVLQLQDDIVDDPAVGGAGVHRATSAALPAAARHGCQQATRWSGAVSPSSAAVRGGRRATHASSAAGHRSWNVQASG